MDLSDGILGRIAIAVLGAAILRNVVTLYRPDRGLGLWLARRGDDDRGARGNSAGDGGGGGDRPRGASRGPRAPRPT